MTAAQVQAILDACDRLRDRFLLSVLWDSGVRIGEALGLRHEDLAAAEQELTVVRRVCSCPQPTGTVTSSSVGLQTYLGVPGR